ncbi:MAG TPA: hypothetical protein VHW47_04030 [Acidimicrobiales bacterium]|jgi:hypothetical protein|nr:hypothetical protein [Acidimicrobiales bacterium]
MSLWTPSGEHPVDDQRPARGAPPGGPAGGPGPGGGNDAVDDQAADDQTVEALRRELAETPPEVVVANHCYGLFELAAVYLSQSPPMLAEAQLAIDALGYMVEGLGERLGEAHGTLREALAQLQLAFVQMGAAEQARQEAGNGSA